MWIEVHLETGTEVSLVNMDRVENIDPRPDGRCVLVFPGNGKMSLNDTYAEIRAKLKLNPDGF